MISEDWLKGTDPDEMLEFVLDRFNPRRWRLLAAAFVRRRWDVVPEGDMREAVDFIERNAATLPAKVAKEWLKRIDAAIPAAIEQARNTMADVVRPADPTSADQSGPILDSPDEIAPAFPLFAAASRHAALAIEASFLHIELAADAVRALFAEPGRETVLRTTSRIEEAVADRAEANRYANNALRMKQQGDELADYATTVKNQRVEESKAIEMVRRLEESQGNRANDIDPDEDPTQRAMKKVLPRFLHELVGNPIVGYRFEPSWYTPSVVDIARTIYDERSFDKMPILADALLDADCDEEAILRHLRGRETHTKDKPVHMRGCWVLDRILFPTDLLFGDAPVEDAPPPLAKKPRAPRKKPQ